MKSAFISMFGVAAALAIGVIATAKIEREPSALADASSGPAAKPRYFLERIPSSAVHHQWGIPNIRIAESSSGNWSGYAVETDATTPGSVFTDVRGTWRVPNVTGSKGSYAYSSSWVGIDGYSSSTVEQLGTEDDWTGKTQSHYAWFEMYPDYAYKIGNFPVNPGDLISAEVSYADGNFTLTINSSNRSSFTITKAAPSALRTSAEWIVEAPWSGRILPLANFGPITFTGCRANGSSISSWGFIDPLTMIGSSGRKTLTLAYPSSLTPDGTGFTVYRQ